MVDCGRGYIHVAICEDRHTRRRILSFPIILKIFTGYQGTIVSNRCFWNTASVAGLSARFVAVSPVF